KKSCRFSRVDGSFTPFDSGRGRKDADSATALHGTRRRGPTFRAPSGGIAAHWKASSYQSILELAEACDVPVRWSCRTGVCHTCERGLVSGAVVYGPEPLDQPADGNLLVCCAQPIRDVVIDL